MSAAARDTHLDTVAGSWRLGLALVGWLVVVPSRFALSPATVSNTTRKTYPVHWSR